MSTSSLSETEAYLIPYPAESFSKPVPIGLGETSIGRETSNDIQISHESVSRNHARIISSDGQFLLSDLDSHNGTFVNAKRIETAVLKHHDKVSFGNRTFLLLMRYRPLGDSGARPLVTEDDTIAFFNEEVEPSRLLAQRAEDAAMGIFQQTIPARLRETESASLDHQRLSLLYQLSEKIRSTQTSEEVMDKGLELILKAIKSAERAMIILGSPPHESLRVSAVKYRNPKIERSSIPVSRTITDWVLTERMALVSQDLSADQRFSDADSIRIQNLNAIIVVPMMKGGKVIGMLYIDDLGTLRVFNQQDVAFAAAVANELALCIENIRLQEEVIRNERMAAIGLTLTDLAHNIKNLLALNQNAVDLMGMQLEGVVNKELRDCWGYVMTGFLRIHHLSIDMLDYAKEEAMELHPTFINQIILDNRQVMEQSLGSKGIQLEFNLSDPDPKWMMDVRQFQRALLNLVVNAVDAVNHQSDARIVIATALDHQRNLIVSVSDNGCGIPPDQQDRIFKLFFTTKGTGGSGLGLPMVKKFTEELCGTLDFQSEVGKGTTFSMSFPWTNAQP